MKSMIELVSTFMAISLVSNGQGDTDVLLIKLNKIYKENRVLGKNRLRSNYNEIFLTN